MRANPTQPDPLDGDRLKYLHARWHDQDSVLRARDRAIEEHIRMLCGRQWSLWDPKFQKFVDVGDWFTGSDKYWQQRPVVNRLLYWFILTHARMTETPGIITYQPATPDRMDQQLAQVMDTVMKTVWSQMGMDDAIDWRTAWMIPCAQAYLYVHVDPTLGDLKPWVGPAMLSVTDELGQAYLGPDGQPMEFLADAVPFDKTGQPMAQAYPDGTYEVTGEPHAEPEGQVQVQALCPLQVRGEWSQRPWHRKRWHMMFSHDDVGELEERYGVKVNPEGDANFTSQSQYELSRVIHGSGWYGAMGGLGTDGMVTLLKNSAGVYTYWEAPSPRFPKTAENPNGGRLMIGTADVLLYDGPRNADFPYTSPLHEYRFVNVPGRPGATTPQEALNPLQRSYNRGYGQMQEYRNLCTQPIGVLDSMAGIRAKDLTNRPGQFVEVLKRQGVKPIEYVDPPRIGEEVFRVQELLRREIREFGWIEGAEGAAPTLDASGELVRELRSNSDRSISPTLKRNLIEDARLMETCMAYLKLLWDEQKILTYSGDDNIPMTVTVLPEMFQQGRVNVVPIIESALPEGPGEREKRAEKYLSMGLWGVPGTPQASRAFFDMAKYTHMGRANRALGGADEVTAGEENGQMVLGVPANEIETWEFYDHLIHLDVHTRFMRTPEFKRLPDEVKLQFMLHRQLHEMLAAPQIQAIAEAEAAAAGPGDDAGGPPAQSER